MKTILFTSGELEDFFSSSLLKHINNVGKEVMPTESLMVEEAIYCHAVHVLRYAGLVQKHYVDKDEILLSNTPMEK